MLYHFKLLLISIVLAYQFVPVQAQEAPYGIIMQSDPSDKTIWRLTCSGGFALVKHQKPFIKEPLRDKDIKITIKANKLYCNGKKISTDRLLIMPQSDSIYINNKPYSGLMMIARKDNYYVLIHVSNNKPNASADVTVSEKISGDAHAIKDSKKKARDYIVRVLLDEKSQLRSESWKLDSSNGFFIYDPREKKYRQRIASSQLIITVKRDNMIYVNNKPFYEGQIFIQSQDDSITFNGNHYRGPMWIVSDENGIKIINCIGLEDYVESVLRTETWPGWPLEINKVCAIASRTYVIAMVQRAKMSACLYHVRNTNKHQTYTGGIASDVIKQAVKETEGVFVTYKGQPITAMFDACCGGIITAKMRDVDFVKAPYLARTYPCEFCKNSRGYSWQAQYDVHEFAQILKNDGMHVRRVRDIKITKKDKAGVVHEVGIKGATHNYHISGKKIYSLFSKKVKSFCFTAEKKGDSIIFKGRGQGHHLGLCQWGAREMVRDGIDYRSVLAFYYPGTQLMHLV